MIKIRIIDKKHKDDINIKNCPFSIFGRLEVSYKDGKWSSSPKVSESTRTMCFPDENYDFDKMANDYLFIGAYDEETCVGVAVLKQGMFKYTYLYDLKVSTPYRRRGIGTLLISEAIRIVGKNGLRGIYAICQDNNLGACLFYLNAGFRIGGLDTDVYLGTSQEGKSDIMFYLDI